MFLLEMSTELTQEVVCFTGEECQMIHTIKQQLMDMEMKENESCVEATTLLLLTTVLEDKLLGWPATVHPQMTEQHEEQTLYQSAAANHHQPQHYKVLLW